MYGNQHILLVLIHHAQHFVSQMSQPLHTSNEHVARSDASVMLEDIKSFSSSSSSEYYKYYDNYTSSTSRMTNPVPVHRNDSPVDVMNKIIKCILCFMFYTYIYM